MTELPLLLAQAAEGAITPPYTVLLIGWIVFLVGLIVFNFSSRAGTIARATTKEALRQPIFFLMTGAAILVMVANYYIPFFSMGEDTKMYIDCGLAMTLICALSLSVWTASTSVAEEIEGKTAMTLLSKPINRRQFVLGKYVGILQSAVIMLVVLGTLFFFFTYFKFGYDQTESGKGGADIFFYRSVGWLPFQIPYLTQERFNVARTILPGLTLIAMEVCVLTAVSVAISTRMPMLVNISTCFSLFVIGHLSPILVQAKDQNVFVKFFAQALATILPSLEHFNMSAAISTGKVIPMDYIGFAAMYCLAYVIAMIMLAFLMFEDRDLA
ncbi:ABC transporter permease subunit [Thalassoglobus polymorphus]|uniref:ABC-2 family transporter protein n=1 Tax=Thalassoglobus polymorphus TaxID=2527994 RepID=A0A517QHL8_9PLAN|nr:ABC transporter permease [Thalassoglobus polymorphus]QDT31119.1 ABC-2 family transporter protein [Thalassoglobus polymorphus]